MTADTSIETHFEFGRNWDSFSQNLSDERIAEAVDGLRRLLPDEIPGASFIDIGSGSGLSALAALRLGCASLTAIDYDAMSVKTTRETLTRYAPAAAWTCERRSVFDLAPETDGRFGVVYSWGVLHHTGDMWKAIESAAGFVNSGGQFAIAIYSTTACDSIWKTEKKLYARAPRPIQWGIRQVYMTALLARQTLTGDNPVSYVRNYAKMRGMNFSHDAHDWLGGYPYETATAAELHDRICKMGFTAQLSFPLPVSLGLFGSGCHEFVFQKI